MSIENRLEELTKAINELPSAIATVLGNTATAVPKSEQKVKDSESNTSAIDTTESGKPETSGGEVAGRKTYVFNKTTKTGQIIEKGEEVPEGDEFVKVGKTNWEKMCDKHKLDPATGNAVEEEESEDDDLGDLDEETEEEGGQEESSEEADDDDLGLDDEEEESDGPDPAEVKKRMVRVMKEVGREDAMKVFKKFGARNFDEIKPSDLQGVYDTAGKLLKKAGK